MCSTSQSHLERCFVNALALICGELVTASIAAERAVIAMEQESHTSGDRKQTCESVFKDQQPSRKYK